MKSCPCESGGLFQPNCLSNSLGSHFFAIITSNELFAFKQSVTRFTDTIVKEVFSRIHKGCGFTLLQGWMADVPEGMGTLR